MKDFLNYYQAELLSLREKGGAFARKHPDIAGNIDIKDGASSDPHTERIIESVAFMAANLSKKIDDNSQTTAFYLLSALYPSLINIFPPCSVIQFEKQIDVSFSDTVFVPKNTSMIANSKAGNACTFKTLYPLNIYPISIKDIVLTKNRRDIGGGDGWCLDVRLATQSVPLENMDLNELLFYINPEMIEDALLIYEAIFSNPDRKVFVKIDNSYFKIDNKNVIACGFNDEDSIAPIAKYSNNSFQLFQEMLHFKNKFMFFKISAIDEVLKTSGVRNIDEISIVIGINFTNERLIQIINKNALLINATPVVNLFEITSDPFRFTGTKSKFLLLADQARDASIEIHSITNVHMINSDTAEDRIIQPYFSLSVDSHNNSIHQVFWTYSKDPAEVRGLNGYDTYLSFVDVNMNPFVSYSDVVYANVLCTNRFETREIPVFSNLDAQNADTGGYTAKILHKTTQPLSIAESTSTLWSLVSQLSSTHLSMAKEKNLLDSVAKLAEIFACGFHLKYEELMSSISTITSNKVVRRFGEDAWRGFVRGTEFRVFVKEDKKSFFNYFFCCVLNQYLSSSVSINSFIELGLVSEKTNRELAKWNPTSGRRDLL